MTDTSDSRLGGGLKEMSAADVRTTINDVLDAIASLSGTAAMHFREAVASADVYGDAIVAQHLRNRLLAYLHGKGLHDQPQVGIKPRMRPEIAGWVEQLDRALERHFELPVATRHRRDRGTRVLLLLDHLPARGRKFSQPRWICTYAAALAMAPEVEAVCVLATQETGPENPYDAMHELEDEHVEGWRAEIEEIVGRPEPKVDFQTAGRVGPVRPYQTSIGLALEFDPDVVFDYQGIFRSRLLPLLLRPRAALAAVQLSFTNPEPPYADLVLAHSYSIDFSDKQTPSKWRTHSIPLVPFPKISIVDPAELGPDSPLRIVTVLTNGRLEKGLMRNDAAGLKFVISFLVNHREAVWLLVAIEDPEAFAEEVAPFLPPGLTERLRLLPAVPDLRAIYQHCHIYMHLPPLEGGGMGIAMAVAEGLPVLARQGTDAANLLHPDQVYRDAAQAAFVLGRLAADPQLRARRSARQMQKLDREHSIKSTSVAFQSLLSEALARFDARGGTAPPGRRAG